MRKRYVYLLERIHDSKDWPKGCRIWAHNHEYYGVQDTYLFCPRCMAP